MSDDAIRAEQGSLELWYIGMGLRYGLFRSDSAWFSAFTVLPRRNQSRSNRGLSGRFPDLNRTEAEESGRVDFQVVP